jgi:hypothetical protein
MQIESPRVCGRKSTIFRVISRQFLEKNFTTNLLVFRTREISKGVGVLAIESGGIYKILFHSQSDDTHVCKNMF